jgi:hypothetical protein
MVQLKPLDPNVPIFEQIKTDVAPVILVNFFQVAEADIPALLMAWEADANWMKQQPGYISTQLHRGIAGSTVFYELRGVGVSRPLSSSIHPSRFQEGHGALSAFCHGIASLIRTPRGTESLLGSIVISRDAARGSIAAAVHRERPSLSLTSCWRRTRTALTERNKTRTAGKL